MEIIYGQLIRPHTCPTHTYKTKVIKNTSIIEPLTLKPWIHIYPVLVIFIGLGVWLGIVATFYARQAWRTTNVRTFKQTNKYNKHTEHDISCTQGQRLRICEYIPTDDGGWLPRHAGAGHWRGATRCKQGEWPRDQRVGEWLGTTEVMLDTWRTTRVIQHLRQT